MQGQAPRHERGDLGTTCSASISMIIWRVRPVGLSGAAGWRHHTGVRGPAPRGRRLAAEVAQDRARWRTSWAHLASRSRLQVYVDVDRRTARLKLNGYLLARSPLSGLEELEMLRLGVEARPRGGARCGVLAEVDKRLGPGRLDELSSRARRQADLLEELRVRAAGQVIGLGRRP